MIKMDCGKVGQLIRARRVEKGMTQKQLAEAMNISDKAVSKWERGLGCPDVSLLAELASLLSVELSALLAGEMPEECLCGGNMKNTKYYVCPRCGGVTLSSGQATVSCCGSVLAAAEKKKAAPEDRLTAEVVEDEWYITSDHPMTRENHISFVAFATGDRVHLVKQYPEWGLSLRVPMLGHGALLWYSTTEGLLYQNM